MTEVNNTYYETGCPASKLHSIRTFCDCNNNLSDNLRMCPEIQCFLHTTA